MQTHRNRTALKVISKNKSSDGGIESPGHAVHKGCGRNNSVVVTTSYGLDGPGLEPRWR